jgi:hypothetical protein
VCLLLVLHILLRCRALAHFKDQRSSKEQPFLPVVCLLLIVLCTRRALTHFEDQRSSKEQSS